jgi:hypothetical protein
MDFAYVAAVLSILMYLLMRTRRMKKRLVSGEEAIIKRKMIVIKHSFDEEQGANPATADTVPTEPVH